MLSEKYLQIIEILSNMTITNKEELKRVQRKIEEIEENQRRNTNENLSEFTI